MAISEVYEGQLKTAREGFPDIVEDGQVLYSESGVPLKLRLTIIDSSIVDSFYSARGRYSYHWDRRAIDGSIYRHDNAPHRRWRHIRTFPKHFHSLWLVASGLWLVGKAQPLLPQATGYELQAQSKHDQ